MKEPITLKAALAYARRGWSVFPLKAREKTPITANGVKDATTDEAQVRAWWKATPDANVGIATGRSGLVVIDVDGDEGEQAWHNWQLENGIAPPTVVAYTGSGGRHFIFKAPDGVELAPGQGILGPGSHVDVRAGESYIVGPGSIHPNGEPYEWDKGAHPAEMAPAALPNALRELLTSPKPATQVERNGDPDDVDLISSGQDEYGARRAAVLASKGFSKDEARAALEAMIEHRFDGGWRGLDPSRPWTPRDVERWIRGAYEKFYDKNGDAAPEDYLDGLVAPRETAPDAESGRPTGRLRILTAAEIAPRPQEWLWRGYIPSEAFTIVDGDMGIGKSQAFIDIAARITRGDVWPDAVGSILPESAPKATEAGVILVAAEDSLEATIIPRLIAAGADLNRVYIMAGEEALKFRVDKPDLLVEALNETGARVVLLDSLMTHMPDINVNTDTQVRKALMPTVETVQRYRATLIGIRHVGKALNANAKHRGLNSVAFSAVARSGIFLAPDPSSADNETTTIFALAKSNLTRPMPSLRYRVVPYRLSEGIDTSRIEWLGVSHYTADMLSAASGDDATSQAARIILEIFATEAPPAGYIEAAVFEKAFKERGVKDWAMKAAKKRLRIRSERSGIGWAWRLPQDGEN